MIDNHPASGFEFEEQLPVKTRRDEIAIASLSGFVAGGYSLSLIPKQAYRLADGMLEEMKKVK